MFITCTLAQATCELRLSEAVGFMSKEEIESLDLLFQERCLNLGRLSLKHIAERKIVLELQRDEITDVELREFSLKLSQAVFSFFMGCYGSKTFHELSSRRKKQCVSSK